MSAATDKLLAQIAETELPQPVAEHRFHPVRKWRFDLAWPDYLVGLEVDGGVYVRGRHTSGMGFENDSEKIDEAVALGWRVLRVTPNHIRQGKALDWITRVLAQPDWAVLLVAVLAAHGEAAADVRCDCPAHRAARTALSTVKVLATGA